MNHIHVWVILSNSSNSLIQQKSVHFGKTRMTESMSRVKVTYSRCIPNKHLSSCLLIVSKAEQYILWISGYLCNTRV